MSCKTYKNANFNTLINFTKINYTMTLTIILIETQINVRSGISVIICAHQLPLKYAMPAELPEDRAGLRQLPARLPKFISKSTLPVTGTVGLLKRIQLLPLMITPLELLLAEQLPLISAVRKVSAPILLAVSGA